jgi:PAS domain S-box-containing protein
MNRASQRLNIILLFGLLVFLLLANSLVIYRQLRVQVNSQQQVMRTEQVQRELGVIDSLLIHAESGQRGYLYTGKASYLSPYTSSSSQVLTEIDKLQQLLSDNAQEKTQVAQLHETVALKLAELAETIRLHNAADDYDARQLVMSDEGLHLMQSYNGQIQVLRREESAEAQQRRNEYNKSVHILELCVLFSSVAAVIGAFLVGYFTLREIRQREKFTSDLHKREEWFRITLTSIGDAVIATDSAGLVTFINPQAEMMTGNSLLNAIGRSIQDVFPIFNEVTNAPVDDPVKKVIKTGMIVGLANHTVLRSTKGTFTPIEDSAAPIHDDAGNLIGVVLVFRDATTERKSQEILLKTEKLAAAARLAATVAHEINNPLEAISNLLYLTQGLENIPSEAQEHLKLAEQELERVSHITRQSLGFFRDDSSPVAVDLVALVESVLKLYENKFQSKAIQIVREFGLCPQVMGMPGGLKQIVSNLISNSYDAVERGGTITIRLSVAQTEAGLAAQLTIEDNGSGISAKDLERIFEPFYTTKKNVGTGLGLWASREIISRHGGRIEIAPRPAEESTGTRATIHLPTQAVKTDLAMS